MPLRRGLLPAFALASLAILSASRLGAQASNAVLSFGGLEWYVKTAPVPVGPGPQLYLPENAFVDRSGRLHLKVSRRSGSWSAAEIFTRERLGYGTYRFSVNSRLNHLDPNVTFGLFTWDGNASDQFNREWDIEFGRWGNPHAAANAQFVVQPYDGPNNIFRFLMSSAARSVQTVTWTPGQVTFRSAEGNGSLINQWKFIPHATAVPTPGDAHLHLNLYLARGPAPSVPVPQEVVIGGFQYTPSGSSSPVPDDDHFR